MTRGASPEASTDERVREVLDSIVHHLEVTRIYLCTLDPETGAPQFRLGRDRTGVDLEPPSEVADELIGAALDGDERVAMGTSPDRPASKPDNVCVVGLPPLFADREPFGLLYVENLDGRPVVDAEHANDLLMLGVAATGVLQRLDLTTWQR